MSSGHTGQWFKRADRGLLGGKTRLTGNHVSPSKRHVRRAWLPNVHLKRLWSDILARHVRINVTPYTLRQVDRMGGVDNYLLYTPPAGLHSRTGLVLRRLLTESLECQSRVAAKYGGAAAAGSGGASSAAAAEAAAAAARQQDAISATLAEIEAAAEPLVSDGDLAAAAAPDGRPSKGGSSSTTELR